MGNESGQDAPCRVDPAPIGSTFVTEDDDGVVWTVTLVSAAVERSEGLSELNSVSISAEVTLEMVVEGATVESMRRLDAPIRVEGEVLTDGIFGRVDLYSSVCGEGDPAEEVDFSSPQRITTCLEVSGPPNATTGDLRLEVTKASGGFMRAYRARLAYEEV